VVVTVEEQGTVGGTFSILGQVWDVLTPPLFLVVVAIGVIIGVIWYFRRKTEELERERNDFLFEEYNKNLRDATVNAHSSWVKRKRYFFFPVLYKDLSLRVLDYRNELIGYYRGHSYKNDGTLVVALYRTKKWLVLEDVFLLKIPIRYEWKVDGVVKNINFEREGFVQWLPNSESPQSLRLSCSSVELFDQYFRVPVFVTPKGVTGVDLRGLYGDVFTTVRTDSLLKSALREGTSAIRDAFRQNPDLGYRQRVPEDVREVE